MDEIKKKISRIEPLLRIRKSQLDESALVLARIQHNKSIAREKLEINQAKYMEGVNRANEIRLSNQIGELHTHETNLDYIKHQWFLALGELREIENQEKLQLDELATARKNLKSLENLSERYSTQLKEINKKKEQKALDEAAVKQYLSKNSN